jgi:predicted transcriptional regulator
VPRLLRGTVRSAFRKEQSYPVMMDWSGKTVAKFAPKENAATVLLIDGQGKILRRYEGVAKQLEVDELCKLIQEILPKQELKVAAKP